MITMISLAMEKGTDIVTVSKIAGHSKPAITLKVYAHTNEAAKRAAFESVASDIENMQQ